jgi:hypothetical protein
MFVGISPLKMPCARFRFVMFAMIILVFSPALCVSDDISAVSQEILSKRMQRMEEKLDAILKHLDIHSNDLEATADRSKGLKSASSLKSVDNERRYSKNETHEVPNNWFMWAIFMHEAWLFMQHANVLLNPYLQRLDRK